MGRRLVIDDGKIGAAMAEKKMSATACKAVQRGMRR